MNPGRFISLDGIDGAGKSAQVAPLKAWLEQRGIRVVTCRDPGSTAVGDAIRAILLDRRDLRPDATCEMLLYMAARAQLVAEVIRPALARGAWVICDRFLLANVVYQGHAGGLAAETIRAVGRVATDGLLPDLVLLLDVDLETSARRLARPLDKLEDRGDGYRGRLLEGYRAEAARDPDRIRVIDGSAGLTEVGQAIRSAMTQRFPELA